MDQRSQKIVEKIDMPRSSMNQVPTMQDSKQTPLIPDMFSNSDEKSKSSQGIHLDMKYLKNQFGQKSYIEEKQHQLRQRSNLHTEGEYELL